MDASAFQFSVSIPRDAQFVPMVRGLAEQAARYADCGENDTKMFAGSVEAAVRERLRDASSDETISVVVRREAGPVECLVDGRSVAVEP